MVRGLRTDAERACVRPFPEFPGSSPPALRDSLRAFILASRADAVIQEPRAGAMSLFRPPTFTAPGGGGRTTCLTNGARTAARTRGPAWVA